MVKAKNIVNSRSSIGVGGIKRIKTGIAGLDKLVKDGFTIDPQFR